MLVCYVFVWLFFSVVVSYLGFCFVVWRAYGISDWLGVFCCLLIVGWVDGLAEFGCGC